MDKASFGNHVGGAANFDIVPAFGPFAFAIFSRMARQPANKAVIALCGEESRGETRNIPTLQH